MASCITSKWANTSPQAKLTVTQSSSTATSATLSWVLEYIADYAASSSVSKAYTVVIGGETVKEGTYSINGKTGTNTVASGTYTVTKGTAAKTISFSVSFGFNLTWSGIYGGTKSASGSISVAAMTSYTVSYNANGGTGAPSSQTKWHGVALLLADTKPTRTGYTFQGWATSSTATTAAYSGGTSYTANASVTLYAVWKAYTYTVSYNANGGTGAPANQTKHYGTALTLSSTKPTRTNYAFKGWGTSASATTVSYAAGASYTANAAITLYAIWEIAYTAPRITKLSAVRGTYDSGTFTEDSSGTYMKLAFSYECDLNSNTIYEVHITGANDVQVFTTQGTLSEYSGTETAYFDISAVSAEASYTVKLTVDDTGGSISVYTTLNGAAYTIDFLAGGKGVSFGKPAELKGVADFGFDAKFNKPVYGKALGMDRLPAIPASSDLNDYMNPGCYAVQSNAIASTVANIPVARAGRVEVWSSTGEGVRAEQWSYLRQRFIPYNSANAVWEREIARSADNVWNYYEWWQSSLTPDAAEKVYSKAAMTISVSASATVSATNSYTEIPFDTTVASTSSRMTLASNSIRIGANIEYVKVNCQVLLKCGSSTGNRHVRIQKISGSTTTSIAWACVQGVATYNTPYICAPVIVSVKEGDLLRAVYYTSDSTDSISAGSSSNGRQTYLTAEEL